jgi:hypothetical protein
VGAKNYRSVTSTDYGQTWSDPREMNDTSGRGVYTVYSISNDTSGRGVYTRCIQSIVYSVNKNINIRPDTGMGVCRPRLLMLGNGKGPLLLRYTVYSISHTLFSYTIPILHTHTLYSYSITILHTHTLYSYSIPILYTHTLYSYSMPILYTHTLYPYSIPILYALLSGGRLYTEGTRDVLLWVQYEYSLSAV